MQLASNQVVTVDGEMMAINGKLLAGHSMIFDYDDLDKTSVCSCNCFGFKNYKPGHELLLESAYEQSLMLRNQIKRASI